VGIEDADGFHGWVGKRTRWIIEPLAESRHGLIVYCMLAENGKRLWRSRREWA
jgi:hypothetical protein